MSATTTRNVREIASGERETLEVMLGGPLAADQQVFILAYTPGAPPDEEIRQGAGRRLAERLAANQAFGRHEGITAAEADEAIAEAMQQTRQRG